MLRETANREGASMKLIPRIGGTWWPACLVGVLLLLLSLGAMAQGLAAGGGQATGQGGSTQVSSGGPETVVATGGAAANSGGEVLSAGVTEIAKAPKPAPTVDFKMPAFFKVEHRQNDEGGAFSLLWPQSPDDHKTDETGKGPAYSYWPFHAPAGPDGSPTIWEQMDSIDTDSSYDYEKRENFNKDFFHRVPLKPGEDVTEPTDDHYSFYESQYPPTGVYSYSINNDKDTPSSVKVTAKVYDTNITDYKSLEVYADLSPFGGQRVRLDFVPARPDESMLPWDNTFSATVNLDTSKLSTSIPYYILYTGNVRGKSRVVLAVQPTRDAINSQVVLVKGSGSEQSVPDNRDKHFFRLYVVPADYEIPATAKYGPTPKTNTSAQNAQLIVDTIDKVMLDNPELMITAEVVPDPTKPDSARIKLTSTNPSNSKFYILVPDNQGIFGSVKRLIDGSVTTIDPVPAKDLLEDSVQLTRSDLPPQAWMVQQQVGPVIGHADWWDGARTNACIWGIFVCAAVMFYITMARKGISLFVRRIAGLDHVDEAIGRATEMGRPILYVTGIGDITLIAMIAAVNILGRVGRKVANYESRLLVPSYDPIVMTVCQEVLQEAYIEAGRPDAFKKDDVFFLTSDQFAVCCRGRRHNGARETGDEFPDRHVLRGKSSDS